MLWIAFDLCLELGNFQKRGMLVRDIAEYYLVIMPGFLVIVLPIALLLSLLYTLTSHARHNEITAIRAAGVSVWRLSLPYLAVGFAGSLALLAINELWEPNSDEAGPGYPGAASAGGRPHHGAKGASAIFASITPATAVSGVSASITRRPGK